MFSGIWVIQFTPLLTGVSAVPTVLRVLWRQDDLKVLVILWTSQSFAFSPLSHHLT
jgi:hypothetical protein